MYLEPTTESTSKSSVTSTGNSSENQDISETPRIGKKVLKDNLISFFVLLNTFFYYLTKCPKIRFTDLTTNSSIRY